MALEVLARRLALSGDFADTDWLDPAVTVPDSARRIKAVSPTLTFCLIGKTDTSETADPVDISGITVDAYLATEAGGHYARGQSLVEVEGGAAFGRVKMQAIDMVRGEVVRVHLTLIGVGAVAAIDLLMLGGGRLL